ncbi:transcriptional regulator [Dendronalium sp. ChiSLP03b]|uniref:transcriptional regulator n=1 Tax=Dendronalium sp. ChiSLP03b TaxID=3075381 RepID=UPI002AD4CE4D|nr:transcriptional regulator [Dendronalium sp. ChiSLP03b]MDZ8204586.1 transcriptional regulator [Dendronalium sp. ChiSLP03b]
MRSPIYQITKLKQTAALRKLEISKLICELRQLTIFSQEQLTTVLGVADGTSDRRENGHIQPSPLALKQIKTVSEDLGNSPELKLHKRSQHLLTKYFLEAE